MLSLEEINTEIVELKKEYEAKCKPFDDKCEAECQPFHNEYWAKRNPLDDWFDAQCEPFVNERYAKTQPFHDEYMEKRQLIYNKWAGSVKKSIEKDRAFVDKTDALFKVLVQQYDELKKETL